MEIFNVSLSLVAVVIGLGSKIIVPIADFPGYSKRMILRNREQVTFVLINDCHAFA